MSDGERRVSGRAACGVAVIGIAFTVPLWADEVTLETGEHLEGTVVEQTTDVVVLEHPVLGRLEIPAASVTSVRVVDDTGSGESVEVEVAEAEGAPPTPEKEWKSKFTLLAGGSFGNSDNQNLAVGVASERENEKEKTVFDARYSYGASDGDRTVNRFTTGIVHDWFIPDSKWFVFGQGRGTYDEFQSWEYRLSGHGGLGWKWIEQENFTATPRFGLGATKQWRQNDTFFEGLLGIDVTWKINERQEFAIGTTIFPDLGNLSSFDFRTEDYATWTVLMDESTNMSFNFSVRHEYQTVVQSGDEHNDWWILAGLQFDF